MSDNKYVYFFGAGKAEGKAEMKNLLGGKGANLAEMTNLNIPVPPGFSMTTEFAPSFLKRTDSVFSITPKPARSSGSTGSSMTLRRS